MRVIGNRALVIGRLPASEQFDIPFGHMEWVGAHIEDNGTAAGTPVDRGRVTFFRTASGSNACDPNVAPATADPVTLTDGDGSIGYTDLLDAYPSLPDSDVTVVDPNGLMVLITDAVDPDGFGVSVGPGALVTRPSTHADCR